MSRRLLTVAVLVAGVLLLAGCNDNEREVRAVFDDVVDLNPRGHVKIADVPVGTVEEIQVTDEGRALVTMSIHRDMTLPSEVTARLRKTNILGERFVELLPDLESGGEFEWGTTITDTSVVPELEQLVASGAELLAAVSVDTLAAALDAQAIGLDGRGETFSTLLDDVTEIVSAYDDNSDDLVRLVDGLAAFVEDVGPEAEMHGRAFAELSRASAVLAEEDERLLDTLADVRSLAQTGTDIMQTHEQRIDRFWTHFSGLVGEIERRNADLEEFFRMWDMHNRNTAEGINAEHAQLFFDFIVCGLNDTPGSPTRSCDDPPQGQGRPPLREPQP